MNYTSITLFVLLDLIVNVPGNLFGNILDLAPIDRLIKLIKQSLRVKKTAWIQAVSKK